MLLFVFIAVFNLLFGFGVAIFLKMGPRPWHAFFLLNNPHQVVQIAALDSSEQTSEKLTGSTTGCIDDLINQAEDFEANTTQNSEEVEEESSVQMDSNSLKAALAEMNGTSENDEDKLAPEDINSLFEDHKNAKSEKKSEKAAEDKEATDSETKSEEQVEEPAIADDQTDQEVVEEKQTKEVFKESPAESTAEAKEKEEVEAKVETDEKEFDSDVAAVEDDEELCEIEQLLKEIEEMKLARKQARRTEEANKK